MQCPRLRPSSCLYRAQDVWHTCQREVYGKCCGNSEWGRLYLCLFSSLTSFSKTKAFPHSGPIFLLLSAALELFFSLPSEREPWCWRGDSAACAQPRPHPSWYFSRYPFVFLLIGSQLLCCLQSLLTGIHLLTMLLLYLVTHSVLVFPRVSYLGYSFHLSIAGISDWWIDLESLLICVWPIEIHWLGHMVHSFLLIVNLLNDFCMLGPVHIVLLGVVGWARDREGSHLVNILEGRELLWWLLPSSPTPSSSVWSLSVSSGPYWTSAVRMSCCSWFSGTCAVGAEGWLILNPQGLVHCWDDGLYWGCSCISPWRQFHWPDVFQNPVLLSWFILCPFSVVFPRYLVPCNHVMLSQKPAVRDVDLYGRAADKFLSLIPRCCRHCAPSPPRPEHASWARGGPSRESGRREDITGMAWILGEPNKKGGG